MAARSSGRSRMLIVVDINAFVVLSQYKIPNFSTFPLDIRVVDLSLEQAMEIYNQQPGWRIDLDTGNQLDQEEALRKIRQHVHLSIWEFFQFEQINQNAIIKVTYLPEQKEK